MAHIFIVCLCRNKCNILKPYIIYNELCTSHFVSVLCSITKVIMLLATDAILLKTIDKLEENPSQSCITVPIFLTTKMEEGESDMDIYIKC